MSVWTRVTARAYSAVHTATHESAWSLFKRGRQEFYAAGYAATGMAGYEIDEALDAKARARIEANTVTVTWPDGHEIFHHVIVSNRTRASVWVNEFNERVGTEP